MENVNKKSTQKIETAETPLDSANSKKQFDESTEEIKNLWNIEIKSKFEREFIKITESEDVVVEIPVNLTENAIILKTKYGKNPFLKCKLKKIINVDEYEEEWIDALLQISSVGLRAQLMKIVKEAIAEPVVINPIVQIGKQGKGIETRYFVSRLY